MSHYTDLDRADSVSSNASSGVSSIGPLTPSLISSPSFTSAYDSHTTSQKDQYNDSTPTRRTAFSALSNIDERSSLTRSTSKSFAGSNGNLSDATGNGVTKTTWRPTHRGGAGTASVDSTRPGLARGGGGSKSYRSGLSPPKEERNIWSDARGRPTSPPLQAIITTPSIGSRMNSSRTISPNRFESASPTRVASPSSYGPSTSYSNSPVNYSNSPVYQSSTQLNQDRAKSSSIFSRDPTVSPNVNRTSSSHRRTQTLPAGGVLGMMNPISDGEQVAGLNRLRLSRQAGDSTQFAPSAVFPSSRSLAAPGSPTRGNSLNEKGLDKQRESLVAYEYLCHLTEAKEWLLSNIHTATDVSSLWDDSKSFAKNLKTGYAVAHLARSLGGNKGKIVLPSPVVKTHRGDILDYAATDNIILFLDFVKAVGLPEIFRFETVDLFNEKGIPKVVYCIHALSHFLLVKNANVNVDVNGMNKLSRDTEFTDAEKSGLDGLDQKNLPDFSRLGRKLGPVLPVIIESAQERLERVAAGEIEFIVRLQSTIRGNRSRQLYRVELRRQARIASERRKAEEEARLQRLAFEQAELRQEQDRLREQENQRRAELERARRLEQEEEQRMLDKQEAIRRAEAKRLRDLENERLAAEARLLAEEIRLEQEQIDHANRVIALEPIYTSIQALIRGKQSRERTLARIREMRSVTPFIINLQATIRGKLVRDEFYSLRRNWRRVDVVRPRGGPSKFARGMMVWKEQEDTKKELKFIEPDIIGFQSIARGFLVRSAYLNNLERLRRPDVAIYLQSLFRGALVRRKYYKELDSHQAKEEMVIRLQTYVRSKNQATQYQQLKAGKNVPIATIKNFVNLLDDSEFDYQDELEIERLKLEVVVAIREVQSLEDDVKDVDLRIALIVKNKAASELARKAERMKGGLESRERNDLLSAARDPFSASTLDAQTRRKLELYQQLFWHLQTNPDYLARLFANVETVRMTEKMQKSMENATFIVFGHGQERREEFLLLKLFARSIEEELAFLPDVDSFTRGDFTFIRLLMRYGRGAQERAYLKAVLAPQVNAVISDSNLDLTIDILTIHRNSINAEESVTGQNSTRHLSAPDVRAAMDDDITRKLYIDHLTALRAIIDHFLDALTASTRDMPFGVRYIARELHDALRRQFPDASELEVLRAVGNLVCYRFIQPAIVAPETFDIIEGGIPPEQRGNLAEICKILNRISVGRLFSNDEPHLQVFNPFLEHSRDRYTQWIRDIIAVPTAEVHFRIDDYSDAASSRPPVIFISPNDIYSTHSLIAEHLDVIAPSTADPVRAIIEELGGAPSSNSDNLSRARADEIALTLVTRIQPQSDPAVGNKLLFNSVKRRILAILKVQHGDNLETIIASPVTDEDEDIWEQVVETEQAQQRIVMGRRRRLGAVPENELHSMSYDTIKRTTWPDIITLRNAGLIRRADRYQALLDSIASDILSRGHRRIQRRSELTSMRSTITSLTNKKKYLADQVRFYQTYVESSMQSIQKKKKQPFVFPWTRQAAHLRKLEKTGQHFAFGSHSYTAKSLYDKGVLLSINQFSVKQFDKAEITISSAEIGLFEVAAHFAGAKMAKVTITLDELLEAQFAGKKTFEIADMAKANLNLLVHEINKKFFR